MMVALSQFSCPQLFCLYIRRSKHAMNVLLRGFLLLFFIVYKIYSVDYITIFITLFSLKHEKTSWLCPPLYIAYTT